LATVALQEKRVFESYVFMRESASIAKSTVVKNKKKGLPEYLFTFVISAVPLSVLKPDIVVNQLQDESLSMCAYNGQS
jgi:hypothetical protein